MAQSTILYTIRNVINGFLGTKNETVQLITYIRQIKTRVGILHIKKESKIHFYHIVSLTPILQGRCF
jgi:hypothetical protein